MISHLGVIRIETIPHSDTHCIPITVFVKKKAKKKLQRTKKHAKLPSMQRVNMWHCDWKFFSPKINLLATFMSESRPG